MHETITRVEFKSYKALAHFSLKLDQRNILVGPNNCGKSTIIGAFRVLAEGLRTARSKSPETVVIGETRVRGYRIPKESIAISTENVHTDYDDVESSVAFHLSNGNCLRLVFPIRGGCFLIPEAERAAILSPKSFKAAFPVTLAVVPVLGPLEHNEQRIEAATVQRNLHTRVASRHFRNYWMYNSNEFPRFAEMIEQTWPNMSVSAPVDDGDVIHMFCTEERIPRELYWAGFGFQVWCQLLTHLDRGREESFIIVDEPEIYLHPELQRQLLDLLFALGPSILMATHSAEIIGAADPRELVLIDKKSRSAKRLATDETAQKVLDSIGSLHNVTLTRIAKHRRVLFVEGKDYSLILKFARIAGLKDLAAGTDLPAVPSDGFSNWTKVRDTAWGIRKILGGPFRMACLLDRDYRPQEECAAIQADLESEIDIAVILKRKEIENYLLAPQALCEAVKAAIRRKGGSKGKIDCDSSTFCDQLITITDDLENDTRAQYLDLAKRTDYLRRIGDKRDTATVIKEATAWFETEWSSLSRRLNISPGKEVLGRIREWVTADFGVSLTTPLILTKFEKQDLAPDLIDALDLLNEFRQSKPIRDTSD